MDNTKLENILKEQKIPFDEAVQKKIAYLVSDDVFSKNDDEYISVFQSLIQTQKSNNDNRELEAAFQSLMSSSETKSMAQSASTAVSSHQAEPQKSASERKMSIAERIAALRGAINVPPEYRRQ